MHKPRYGKLGDFDKASERHTLGDDCIIVEDLPRSKLRLHQTELFNLQKRTLSFGSLFLRRTCVIGPGSQQPRRAARIAAGKRIRQLADQMITKAKEGSLHSRRLVLAKLHQETQVARLFDVLAPQYKNRQGGYTRIYKLGPRIGDAAEMSILTLVETDEEAAASKAAAEAPAEEAPAAEEAK